MKKQLVLIAASSVFLAISTPAALVATAGYTATSIYSGAWLGGFGTDGTKLYVGDLSAVYSMDANGGNVLSVGALPVGDDNAIVNANPLNSKVFAAVGSYTSPFPYQFGRFAGSSFSTDVIINGAYDAAFSSGGDLFITALHEDYTGDGTNDTAVYHFDQILNQLTRVAEVGGYSGGLALDSNGNLFYGSGSGIVSFDAADIAGVLGGGSALTLGDATLKSSSAASYLAFDAADNLYATRLDAFWNTELVAIDGSGTATVIGNGGGGHIAVLGNTIFTAGNDYSDFSSNVYAVAAIPEPSTIMLMLGGFGGLVWFRKRRRYYFSS